MDTLKDVLLYLARHVPAGPADLAAMEAVIGQAFEPAPAPAPAPEPAPAPAGQEQPEG